MDKLTNKSFITVSGIEYINKGYIAGGSFGEVFKVEHNNKEFALKIMKSPEEFKSLWELETKILQHVKSYDSDSKLVQIFGYGCLLNSPANLSDLYLTLELLGPSVYEIQHNFSRKYSKDGSLCAYSHANIKQISRQTVEAMIELHRLGVLHLDLKPENIFFVDPFTIALFQCKIDNVIIFETSNATVKVGDFGCSCLVESASELSPTVQTQNYRAPEIFLELEITKKADVWSFGCVLAEMYTGELLFFGSDDDFSEETQLNLMQKVLRSPIPNYMYELASKANSENVIRMPDGRFHFKKFVTKPLKIKPIFSSIRTNDFEAILLFETIISALFIDPDERLEFREIIELPYFN